MLYVKAEFPVPRNTFYHVEPIQTLKSTMPTKHLPCALYCPSTENTAKNKTKPRSSRSHKGEEGWNYLDGRDVLSKLIIREAEGDI
jgi:hypothetical protein